MIFLNRNKGFTLIELLVVIAIIGLLTSIVLVSIRGIGARARDAKRKSDLDQIRKALLLYAFDHNDSLPSFYFGWNNAGNGWATNRDNGNVCCSHGDLEDFLDGTDPDVPSPKKFYIKMPHDPKYGGCDGYGGNPGGYMYYHSGSSCAVLFAHLEKPSAEDLATCDGVCVGIPPGYGMNYCVEIKP